MSCKKAGEWIVEYKGQEKTFSEFREAVGYAKAIREQEKNNAD